MNIRRTTHESSESERSDAAPSLRSFLEQPLPKYLGFAFLLSWHYVFWFVPSMFINVGLMDNCVTYSWLVNLAATALFAFLIAVFLGRKRRLSAYRFVAPLTSIGLAIGTIVLATMPFNATSPMLWYGTVIVLGAFEAALWTLWSERYARIKANFSIRHVGTVYGIVLLACIAIAYALPEGAASIFAAALPLLSGGLLALSKQSASETFPMLLPRNAASGGVKNMLLVGFLSLFATAACYFLVAIIPWEELPTRDGAFTAGILLGALLMLSIAGICALSKDRLNAFKIYPWLLVAEIVSFALFLSTETMYMAAFAIATGLSSIFEILLVMYFGILMAKGYATPALSFACACGFSRAGKCLGNTLAVSYENFPAVGQAFTPETALAFICLLSALIIPLVRQEFSIVALTTMAPSKSEIEEICAEVAAEFSLSARETEILLLIARGHTTNSMAEKLVISPYTVNTHIRHIYDKMQIHKRAELLNYLNMQRSDF